MKRWPTKPLGELCDVRIGRTPRRDEPRFWGGDAVWVSIRELNGGEITSSKEMLSEAAVCECMPEPIPTGTLLFSFKLSIGKMAIAGCPLYTNEAIAALPIRKPAELSRDFLRYALLRESHEGTANTAVMGKVLNKEKVQQLQIPVPLLAEQERIVKLLDEADELRKLRAQADRRSADLIPALFHEMFGDPMAGTGNWERKTFGDLLERIDGGWSPTCHDRPAQPEEWGVLKLGAVTACQYLDTETKALPENFAPRPDLEVKVGDLLFTRKNTYELVAACAFVFETRPKLMLSDLIFRFRLKPGVELNPIFLWGLLTVPSKRKQVQALAGGSAGSMPNISKGRLMMLPIEVPPLPLQKQFAQSVSEIRALQAAQAASRKRTEHLFQSMLHRAFAQAL
ncbi:MAG: restriction endonuclease subunit S [Gallionella sp.]